MAYASRVGRARVSARNPQALAVCQRCGMWYNRVDLNFQFQWRGAQLQNTYILVCEDCLDIPTEQNRAIILPADPVPIFYPSVENFAQDETDFRTPSRPTVYDPITGIPIPPTDTRVTENANPRTTLPFGRPTGEIQDAVQPLEGVTHYGVPLQLLSVTASGTATIQVTCSKAHGLVTNNQISVEGLSAKAANGFYSVAVLSAMAFTYMTYGSIPTGSLLTPSTLMITAFIGLPLGYDTIPKIFGPPLTQQSYLLELESGAGSLLLESGLGFLELQEGS